MTLAHRIGCSANVTQLGWHVQPQRANGRHRRRPIRLAVSCYSRIDAARDHRGGIPGDSRAKSPADHEQRSDEERTLGASRQEDARPSCPEHRRRELCLAAQRAASGSCALHFREEFRPGKCQERGGQRQEDRYVGHGRQQGSRRHPTRLCKYTYLLRHGASGGWVRQLRRAKQGLRYDPPRATIPEEQEHR